jgi:hypothetical protein
MVRPLTRPYGSSSASVIIYSGRVEIISRDAQKPKLGSAARKPCSAAAACGARETVLNVCAISGFRSIASTGHRVIDIHLLLNSAKWANRG